MAEANQFSGILHYFSTQGKLFFIIFLLILPSMEASFNFKNRRFLHPDDSNNTVSNRDNEPPPPNFEPEIIFVPDPSPQNKVHHLTPILIIVIAALGGCFLIVSYYAIIIKYCSNLRNPRRRSQLQSQNDENQDTHEDFVAENHGPIVDHPIWYIRTVGLPQSVIDSIAVLTYKKGDGLIEGTDCSVCLSEFEEGEKLRLLPKCSHAFHLPCIDTWLRSHTNCPSCRALILDLPVTNVGSNSSSSDVGEGREVDNSGSDVGFGDDVDGEDGVSGLTVGDESDDHVKNIEVSKEDLLSPLDISGFRVCSDLSDNHRLTSQNKRQMIRRSASMDFSPAPVFCFSVADSLPEDDEEEDSAVEQVERGEISKLSPEIGRLVGSSSKGSLLPRSPVPMKRSISSGGKLMLSRSRRTWRSTLPL